MSNIFRWNTTDIYNLLKYKRQHVSVPIEPASGQFDSLGLRELSVCSSCDPNPITVSQQPSTKTVDQYIRNMWEKLVKNHINI
jgi:hypothetical protein